jgi:excisionase family DNA binding protein
MRNKMKTYYDICLNGLALIEAKNGIKTSFDKWISSVSEWLRTNNNEDQVFEWFSLNIISDIDPANFVKEDKMDEYFDLLSERFAWLAKLICEHNLPSKSEDYMKDFRGQVRLENVKIDNILNMGINGLRISEFHQGHQNFIIWLKAVADKFHSLSMDSGLIAEWLSLPMVTFYIDGVIIGGTDFYQKLINVVIKRINWLCEIFNIESNQFIDKINTIKEASTNHASSLAPLYDGMIQTKPINKEDQRARTNYQSLLAGKEWLTLAELEVYTGYKKKTIYNRTSNGTLPYSKPRGKLMFKRSEIDDWLIDNSGYLKGPNLRKKQSSS